MVAQAGRHSPPLFERVATRISVPRAKGKRIAVPFRNRSRTPGVFEPGVSTLPRTSDPKEVRGTCTD